SETLSADKISSKGTALAIIWETSGAMFSSSFRVGMMIETGLAELDILDGRSRRWDSNPCPAVYETARPTELRRRLPRKMNRSLRCHPFKAIDPSRIRRGQALKGEIET